MYYEELYEKAYSGDLSALKELEREAGAGNAEAQYVLSCIYDNDESPFKDTNLGMHWLTTSAGYEYEPAMKKMKELPEEIKRQYGIETDSDNADVKDSNAASGNILSYKGRINRMTYFLYFVFYVFSFGIVLAVIDAFSSDSEDPLWPTLWILFRLVSIYLIAVLCIKRLHDCGHSGWWTLVPLCPLVLLFLEGDENDNEYGVKPD